MPIDETTLTKGQSRKLNALRKSVGDKLAEDVFSKWMKEQAKAKPAAKADPVAKRILEALKSLESDKSIKLGNKGYMIKRSKGKGAKGFVVEKILK